MVITRDPFFIATGCLVVHSLREALDLAAANGEEEAFIIGGAEIYSLSLPFLDRLYLTEVDAEPEGDVFFPEIDLSEWNLISSESHPADEKNEHPFTIKLYERKEPRQAK